MSHEVQNAQLEQINNNNPINKKLQQYKNERLGSIEEQKVSNEYSNDQQPSPSNINNQSNQRLLEDDQAIDEIDVSEEESKIEPQVNEISESESKRFVESPKSNMSCSVSQKMNANNSIKSNTRSQNNLLRRGNDSRGERMNNNTDRNSLVASLGQSLMSDSREQVVDFGLDIQSQNAISVSNKSRSSNSSDHSIQAPSSHAQSSNWSRDDSSPQQIDRDNMRLKSQFYPEHGRIVEDSKEEESKNESSVAQSHKQRNSEEQSSSQSRDKNFQRQRQKQLMQINSSGGGSQKFNVSVSRRVIGKGGQHMSQINHQEDEKEEEDPRTIIEPPLLKKVSSRQQRKLSKMQAKMEKKMKRYRKKIRHMFKYNLIMEEQKDLDNQISRSMDIVLCNNMYNPSLQNIEVERLQKAQQQQDLINEIQKSVQQGGDNVLQRFNSFGESSPEGSSNKDDHSPKQIAERGNAAYFQKLVQNGCDPTKRKSSSSIGEYEHSNQEDSKIESSLLKRKSSSLAALGRQSQEDSNPLEQEIQGTSLVQDQIDKEEYKDIQVKEPESKHKHISFSQTANNIERKQSQETPVIHSIIVRQIFDKLQSLMIAFNEGRIIQMTLEQKLNLKDRIEKFIQLRNDEQKVDFQQQQRIKAFCFNSLDNAEIYQKKQGQSRKQKQQEKAKPNQDMIIQQMRSNYYRDRSMQSKLSQNLFKSNNRDLGSHDSIGKGKLEAIEKDYDFYFRHHHNIFVVQSQIKNQQLIRLKKSLNLAQQMQSMQQFEETKNELFQEDINFNQKTLCFDIENVFVKLMDINDIEQFNQLREASDTDFHDYILINKTKFHDQREEQSPELPQHQIYRANRYLERNKNQLLQIIHNYDEIKFEDRNPMQQSVGSTSPPDRESKAPCCQLNGLGKLCMCNKFLFHVRPYTFEFLRALQPFFEIVATSNISYYLLEQIIDHIEFVLNKPITDMIIKQAESRNKRQQEESSNNQMDNSPRSEADGSPSTNQKRFIHKIKKKRRQKKIEPKIFFQLLISNINYHKIDVVDHDNKVINESLENLFILTQNRKADNIFLISSNQFKLVAAMDLGFCAIPIIKYQMVYMTDDYQLNLLENYLHKLKYSQDIKYKNQKDFGYLSKIIQQYKRQEPQSSNTSNLSRNNSGGNKRNISVSQSQNMSNNEMMQICSQNISFGDGNVSGSSDSQDLRSSNQQIGRIASRPGKKLNKTSFDKVNVMKSSLIDSDDDKSSSSLSSSEEEKSEKEKEVDFKDLQSSNDKGVFDNIMDEIEQRDQIIHNQLKSLNDYQVIAPVKEEAYESSSSKNCKKNSDLSIYEAVNSGCFGVEGHNIHSSSSHSPNKQSQSNQSSSNQQSKSLPDESSPISNKRKSQSRRSLQGSLKFNRSEKSFKKETDKNKSDP